MTPSAAEILERTASAYASCSSYRDSGEAVMVSIKNDQSSQESSFRRPFWTLFVRPALFRYEFTSESFRQGAPDERYVVWSNGGSARSWWSLRPTVMESSSLLVALAGPTGVSFGSAYRVPYLLIPYPEPRSLPVITTARLRADASPDGECFVVSGPTLAGHEVEVWIDSRSFLIRMARTNMAHGPESQERWVKPLIESSDTNPVIRAKVLAAMNPAGHFEPFRSETTTTYEPEVNVDISAEEFEFTPPQ